MEVYVIMKEFRKVWQCLGWRSVANGGVLGRRSVANGGVLGRPEMANGGVLASPRGSEEISLVCRLSLCGVLFFLIGHC